ncbi:glycosyl hydrolase [Mycena filopes]|nr:glycosyl hydrolase [Mycena filopes]
MSFFLQLDPGSDIQEWFSVLDKVRIPRYGTREITSLKRLPNVDHGAYQFYPKVKVTVSYGLGEGNPMKTSPNLGPDTPEYTATGVKICCCGSRFGSGSNADSRARTPNANAAFGSAIGRTLNLNVAFGPVRFRLSARSIAILGTLLELAATGSCRKNKYIVPGATWYDTSGAVLSAHAGGIVESASGTQSYWFNGKTNARKIRRQAGINVYSSSDLLNWEYRPKAVFNAATQEWVLWFHSDNSTYGLLQQGVATSPDVTGAYTFQDVFSPLGGTSQDFGLFQDVDGDAYALYSNGDADAAHDNLITRMNANYTNVEEVVYTFFEAPDFDLEAPNMLFTGGRYYILMSHKTGYRPTTSGTRTFNSQSTMTIVVAGSRTTTFIYCGDQCSTAADLYDSRYIWLPADINDHSGSFTVDWHDLYTIDTRTGEVAYPQGTVYEAEHGLVSGSAYATICPTCSGSKIVTGITGNASLTVSNIVGTGEPQWVSFYYHNPDGLFGDNRGVSGQSFVIAQFASVSVNGAAPVTLRQRSRNAGIILTISQPLNVTFNHGGSGSGPAAELNNIVIYGNVYEE